MQFIAIYKHDACIHLDILLVLIHQVYGQFLTYIPHVRTLKFKCIAKKTKNFQT